MSGATTDLQEQPITAEWLKANTRIHGWFAFFIFALALGGLFSLVYPIVTYKASDYMGSTLLGMTDIITGVMLAVVALWTIVSLCRRSQSAIFWAKFYTILVLVTNGLALWLGGANSMEIKMGLRSIVWAIVWFLYLTCSQQVQEVIPKRYRHAGARTWVCAGLLLLLPLGFLAVGVVDVVFGYHKNVEILQSELSDGELTDGHVVFGKLDGWSFGMARDEDVNVCSFTKDQELVMTLLSTLDADDSRDNFIQIAAASALADFEKLAHRIVRDDADTVNGHVCHYRIVQYDRADFTPVFWHFACMFDNESGKVVVVSGYFLDKDIPEVMKLLKSVRFKK